MKKIWLDGAWEEYLNWLAKDKRSFKKINQLIQSIERNGYRCIGKLELLTANLKGWWSVRINHKSRLVFKIEKDSIKGINYKLIKLLDTM